MIKLQLTSVIFDTDGDSALAAALSTEWLNTVFTVDDLDDTTPEEVVADTLSDETGWCVEDLAVEVLA